MVRGKESSTRGSIVAEAFESRGKNEKSKERRISSGNGERREGQREKRDKCLCDLAGGAVLLPVFEQRVLDSLLLGTSVEVKGTLELTRGAIAGERDQRERERRERKN